MKQLKIFLYRRLLSILKSGYLGNFALTESLFNHLPDKLDAYIDVGAFNGSFFDLLRREKKIENAFLIEPQKKYYELLLSKYGDLPWISVSHSLISNVFEERILYIYNYEATSSLFRKDDILLGDLEQHRYAGSENMKTVTLDSILRDRFDKIDLLKIDVQGAELMVLEGAEFILEKTNFIWIEVSFKALYENIPSFQDIYVFLSNKNFSLLEILPGYRNKEGELLQIDCLFGKKKT